MANGLYKFEFTVYNLSPVIDKGVEREATCFSSGYYEVAYLDDVLVQFFRKFGEETVQALYADKNVNRNSVNVLPMLKDRIVFVEYKIYYKLFRESCVLKKIFLNNRLIWQRPRSM